MTPRYELRIPETAFISKEVNVWDRKTENGFTIPTAILGKEDQRKLRETKKIQKENL